MSGIGSDAGEKEHEQFITKIYNEALKVLIQPSKLGTNKSQVFAEWMPSFNTIVKYAREKSSGFLIWVKNKQFVTETIDTIINKNALLEKFFDNFAQSNKNTLDKLEKYIESLIPLHEKLREAARAAKASSTPREYRWAVESLAALVNALQLGAANLYQDVIELLNVKSGGKTGQLVQQSAEFLELAQRLQKKSERPILVDTWLDRAKSTQIVKFSSDAEFEKLQERIRVLPTEINNFWQKLLLDVIRYAQKHNKQAYVDNKALNFHGKDAIQSKFDYQKTAAEKALAARQKAQEIEKKFFTSRSKRYPYELYADLWERASKASESPSLAKQRFLDTRN